MAAPKPVCAALETMRPASMSNWTRTLCIVMMPNESTENWSPSGTPCTMCCVTSFFVQAKSRACAAAARGIGKRVEEAADRADELRKHRRDGCARYAPVEAEDKKKVEADV